MDPYDEGYEDGVEGWNDNPYVELSPEWVDYEEGWDDGYEDGARHLKGFGKDT